MVVAAVLDERVEGDEPITARIVERVLDDQARIEFSPVDGGEPMVLTGPDYEGDGPTTSGPARSRAPAR